MATHTQQSEYNIINRKIVEELNIELMEESNQDPTYSKILDKDVNIRINNEIYISPKKVDKEVLIIDFETSDYIEESILEKSEPLSLEDMASIVANYPNTENKYYYYCNKASQYLLDNSFKHAIKTIEQLNFNILLQNIPIPVKKNISIISKSEILNNIQNQAQAHSDLFTNKKRRSRLDIEHYFKCLLTQETDTQNSSTIFKEFTNALIIESILDYITKHDNTNRELVLEILTDIILTIEQNYNDEYSVRRHEIFIKIIKLKSIYPKLNTAKLLDMTYKEAKKYINKSNQNFTEEMYSKFEPLKIETFYKYLISHVTIKDTV